MANREDILKAWINEIVCMGKYEVHAPSHLSHATAAEALWTALEYEDKIVGRRVLTQPE